MDAPNGKLPMQTRDVRDGDFAAQEIEHQVRDTANMAIFMPSDCSAALL
jgi:hypothetical protein